ncbi:MAG: hypothetical protein OHK0045_17700 [Raineya sp.]
MYKFASFFILSFLFFFACQTSHEHHQKGTLSKENQALYEEVMKIHDEVMPKQSIIAKYRDTLDLELKEEKIQKDTLVLNKYRQIREQLNYAYQAMNIWMQEFEVEYEGKSEEEIKKYLEKEKDKISKIADKMLSSLEAATNRAKK